METESGELKKLEIPAALLAKFHERRPGEPRCTRDEMLDIYVARLNASNVIDKYAKTNHARVAKMLEGIPTEDLHAIYMKCSTYRKFGAGLHYELKPRP